MSFTEDELQAFNEILAYNLASHRQEIEQTLDQRLNAFRQEIEQQVDCMLAAQLLGIEQLLSQHVARWQEETNALLQSLVPQFEGVEIQAELPWEELARGMDTVLDARLVSLNNSFQRSFKNLEYTFTARLHDLREEIARHQAHGQTSGNGLRNGNAGQELLVGIDRLERVMESMQVAMTANYALLSNHLHNHQQLPPERAHAVGQSPATPKPSLPAQSEGEPDPDSAN